MPMTALEQEFDNACVDSVRECQKLEYDPKLFVRMRSELGAVEACRRLINAPNGRKVFPAVGNETTGFVHRGVRARQSKVQAPLPCDSFAANLRTKFVSSARTEPY